MATERRLVVATDLQGMRHLALLHITTSRNDSIYTVVVVSTACIPSTTKAETLTAWPFDLPMIQHRGLTLVSYQRVSLSSPPATCMVCMAHAASIP